MQGNALFCECPGAREEEKRLEDKTGEGKVQKMLRVTAGTLRRHTSHTGNTELRAGREVGRERTELERERARRLLLLWRLKPY